MVNIHFPCVSLKCQKTSTSSINAAADHKAADEIKMENMT